MKSLPWRKIIFLTIATFAVAGLGWLVYERLTRPVQPPPSHGGGAAAVAVAEIEIGPISHRRTFSGTLESPARFVAAAKIAGRINRLHVNLADPVTQDQLIAELDNLEFLQDVAQAEAELLVAQANQQEAANKLVIAQRNLERITTLRERGVASDTQLDSASAEQLTAQAAVAVANAQVTRAQSTLEAARIRLDYTRIRASWRDGGERRYIAQRYVEEGDTVAANAPLFDIVELDPIRAVVFVSERDYAHLRVGQPVTLRTDAFPGETFMGEIERISPVFREASRQARVQILVPNHDVRLRPGMFVRATIVLSTQDEAIIVPLIALAQRQGQDGLFVLDEAEMTVRWEPVTVGIREADRVQVVGDNLEGRVVTLGHQLVRDGSAVRLPMSGEQREAVRP